MIRLSIVLAGFLLLLCASGCGGHGGQGMVNQDTAFSLTGLWVNKSYADTLLRTHSPRTSQKVTDATCLYFTDSAGSSVQVGLGFHEGTYWTILRNQNKVMLYDSDEKRNMGEVEPISPEEIRLGQQHFIKLKHPVRDRYDNDIVEELLFAGYYRTKEGSTVTFTPDGRVLGWDTIRYYTPDVDYIGPGLDVDEVEMGSDSNRLTTYGFKFDKDTLLIYKLNCLEGYDSTDNSCGVVDFGDLKWKLLKRH